MLYPKRLCYDIPNVQTGTFQSRQASNICTSMFRAMLNSPQDAFAAVSLTDANVTQRLNSQIEEDVPNAQSETTVYTPASLHQWVTSNTKVARSVDIHSEESVNTEISFCARYGCLYGKSLTVPSSTNESRPVDIHLSQSILGDPSDRRGSRICGPW